MLVFSGVPAEMFMNGAEFWLAFLSHAVAIPIVANFYLPIFYRCGLTSVFEYIHHR